MKITFLNGSSSGQTLDSGELQEITLGRDNTNMIPLDMEGVSRNHAVLRFAENGWLICDLGSTNGVKVNGTLIAGEFMLSDGDLIEIGTQKLAVSGLRGKTPVISFAPAQGTMVVESGAAQEEAQEEFDRDKLMASISAGTLFTAGTPEQVMSPEQPVSDDRQTVPSIKVGGRKFISPVLFYTIVVCLTVVALTACLKLFSPAKKVSGSTAASVSNQPLSLYFEKLTVSQENVFRFSVSIENRKAVFYIDDIRSRRHPEPFIVENPAGLEVLISRLNNSGIWNVRSTAVRNDSSGLYRRLGVVLGGKIVNLSLSGHRVGAEVEDIESAIYEFAEGCGMQTVSLSGDEILKMATDNFNKAEDLYANRESGGANLRDSIARYRLVVNYLNEFSPPQAIWKKAKIRLTEAESLLKNKLDELEYRRVTLQNARDFTALRRVFLETMELTERDSKEYNLARKRLHILDSHLKKSRGSR